MQGQPEQQDIRAHRAQRERPDIRVLPEPQELLVAPVLLALREPSVLPALRAPLGLLLQEQLVQAVPQGQPVTPDRRDIREPPAILDPLVLRVQPGLLEILGPPERQELRVARVRRELLVLLVPRATRAPPGPKVQLDSLVLQAQRVRQEALDRPVQPVLLALPARRDIRVQPVLRAPSAIPDRPAQLGRPVPQDLPVLLARLAPLEQRDRRDRPVSLVLAEISVQLDIPE